jgi:hypothetical protein
MTIAYPTVPVGPRVHDKDGLCDCPSHVNATGIAPPVTMSGLVSMNGVVAEEIAAVLGAVVRAVDVVARDGVVVRGSTSVIRLCIVVCAEHPAVTRIIHVTEVIIRRFMEMTIRSFASNRGAMWLRSSE